ncbi:MAG: hypothetical protein K8H90_04760 [Thermoanaerobaculia bacterium]|nr:hypothetical protein [Thermoanaerobaculia bacterium]
MRFLPLVLFAALTLPHAAGAQPPSTSAQSVEKMGALAFLAGEWEGEAWMQLGPDRRDTVSQHERVEWRAGNEVLVIQGKGRQGDRVVHDAFAAIAWDARKAQYVMWTYRAGGGPTEPTIEVGDQRIVWGFDSPGGKIRFTIALDANGRWVETGERSADAGATWQPFFGMTLVKK